MHQYDRYEGEESEYTEEIDAEEYPVHKEEIEVIRSIRFLTLFASGNHRGGL